MVKFERFQFENVQFDIQDDDDFIKSIESAFNPNVSVKDSDKRDLGLELEAGPARNNDERHIRNALIGNLVLCSWESPDQIVHYSRDNNHYANTRNYHPSWYTRRKVVWAVESLVEAGLAEDFKTAPSATAMFRSRVKPTPKFIARISFQSIDEMIFGDSETIWMKDTNKHLINYRPTSEVRRMRRDVESQNELLVSLQLEIDHPDWRIDDYGLLRSKDRCVNLKRRALNRIFNNGRWDSGGRFYRGWWQNISGREREAITINGAPVIEIDYRNCHPRLMYGILDKSIPYDPYEIDGVPRKCAKLAFNILINSSNRPAAIKAIAKHLSLGEGSVRTKFARQTVEATENRNPELAPFFCTGIGLKLQRIDSDICSKVQCLLRNQGIPTLSVHDSFLVPQQKAGVLKEAMEAAMNLALHKISKGSKRFRI